jgi:hypothetical protein
MIETLISVWPVVAFIVLIGLFLLLTGEKCKK